MTAILLTVTQVNGNAANVGTLITLGSGAQLTLNSNGTFDYDPNGAFDSITTNTTDNFTYQIGDGNGGFDMATATITITPVNDPPTAVDDAFDTNQDTTLNDDLFAANPTTPDSDPEGDPLSVTQVNGNAANVDSTIALGSGAQLTVNNDGTFSYNPNGQFDTLAGGVTTTDSFTYQIGDGSGGFDTATATVTITGVNDAPVAIDDAFTTNEDTALTSGNVLSANPTAADSDIDDGDMLTVTQVNGNAANVGTLITLGSGAQLTLNSNGTFTYDPNGAFDSITTNTTDIFSYQIGDGNGGFDSAATTITLTPVNDAPVNTVPGAQTTNSVTPITFTTISISDVDAGSGSLQSVISSTFGTLTVASGSGAVVSNDGSSSVTITGTLAQINAALNGLEYDPDGATGMTTITLATSDQGNTGSGGAQTDTDTITVNVGPPNVAPAVDLDGPGGGVDFSASFTEDAGPVNIADLDAIITDADAGDNIESLTITLTNVPDGGSEGLSISGMLPAGITATTNTATLIVLSGSASPADYTTALQLIQYNNTSDNPNTTDRSITVVANDGDVDSATATSTISVAASNDAPVASNQSYNAIANTLLEVAGADLAGDVASTTDATSLLTGATDVDNVIGDLSVSAETKATTQGGSVTLFADGSFHYTPDAGDSGITDTFTYTLQDGSGGTDTATVTITIGSEVVWYVDDDAAAGGDGTSVNPFSNLSALDTGGGSDGLDGAGDIIYVLDGTYTAGIVLENNQMLLGQGVDLVVGMTTVISGSAGTTPTISDTGGDVIELASGNTIQGLNIGNSNASGFAIDGTTVGSLTIADVSINNTNSGGFRVSTSGALNVTLASLSANGGGNSGLILANTTGSFTVTGDGTGAANGSGGTLQNATGDAVSLTNAQNVSLTQLNINNASDHGIDISNVTNFTYQDAIITGVGAQDDEHSIRIRDLLGTSLIEDVTFDDINEDAIEILNTSGTSNITLRRIDIQDHTAALNGEHGIDIGSDSTANLTVLIDDSDFDINVEGSLAINAGSMGSSVLNVTVQNSTFNAEDAFGSGSIVLNAAGNSTATFVVAGNDLNGSEFTPIDILNNDNATSFVTVSNNDIDVIGTGHNGFGIRVQQDENGEVTALIDNNTVDATQFQAILVRARDTTDGSGLVNATITNNITSQPLQAFVGSLSVESQDSNTVNVNITSNTLPGVNSFPGFDSGINLDAADSSIINVTQTSLVNLSAVNNGSPAGDAMTGGTVNFGQPVPPTP